VRKDLMIQDTKVGHESGDGIKKEVTPKVKKLTFLKEMLVLSVLIFSHLYFK
jgi:hypothetical protein